MRMVDITGQKFGRLTAIMPTEKRQNGKVVWLCECECGNETLVTSNRLRSGNTSSCGCLYAETRKGMLKHGGTGTRLYRIWKAMHNRCNNKNTKDYEYYGGRGIVICNEWNGEHGFENFLRWAKQTGYNDNLTIDRINPNGNYYPENCEWITQAEQNRNTRKQLRTS